MSEKRMFSRKIIESDEFLELPLSAQGLYMHICMEADDDGFVNNANRICRLVEASKEDYQMLFDRGYLLRMSSTLIVIVHWRICNTIRKDRYKPTVYQSEYSKLKLLDDVYVLDYEDKESRYVEDTISDKVVERFEEFWEAYPRKEHRALAEQEYAILVMNGISEEMLIASAKAYAMDKDGTEKKYLKCPDKWLGSGIYTDYEVREREPDNAITVSDDEPDIDYWHTKE